MVMIEKSKKVLFVILFVLVKKTINPSTPVEAIAIPTERRSKSNKKFIYRSI